ncbi:MAG TPA: pyridoxal phosphate-dependent aminotransferase family protein [Pedobacter sp.]|uniref:aminotransferase class I/II-fold pyridoxal phosphate-dependent enzyme n=1 Tax=Pedobacter sp. TaxID=1411316 RepID=UPI002BB8B825|nr:pyridoxal phosphate-dependent aminotransferase family protein [Pedobacter sp.]HMI03190.1 pyridoxal phosphate-dependent aminotransferase family protein [Pedobacter sp.]
MNTAEQFIKDRLESRANDGALRKLSSSHLPIDFCSNDYLGFARSIALKEQIDQELKENDLHQNGSGGSRLLSGNTAYTEETEFFIAAFHQAQTGLIFNSGYDANVGLLSCLAQRGDTIITDELVHASLVDGARLTHAGRYTFRHNDLNDLETKLKNAKGNSYVVTESVYSMDGDIAPLTEINALCEQYNANFIVDEAHAIGIFGQQGKGLVQQLGLQDRVFARIVTFGKALGCHGAAVLGSPALRQYLINFARSFIYTTAAPVHTIASVKCAYQMLTATDFTTLIRKKIKHYADLLNDTGHDHATPTPSAIQTLLFPGNAAAKLAAALLQDKGFDVRAILSPTVKSGQERLRICLHTYNTDEEIRQLASEISQLKNNE